MEDHKLVKDEKNDEDGYDPHLYRELKHGTSDIESLIHLFKGLVGTGILALPRAFMDVGLVGGAISTIIIGFICGYCIRQLIKGSYVLCKKTKVPLLTYSQSMACALANGPPSLRKFSNAAWIMVDFFLVTYQLGVCSVYLVFVIVNLKSVCDYYTDPEWPQWAYFAIMFIPFLLVNAIRNLKVLVPVSIVSTIFTFASFGICIYYILCNIPNINDRPKFSNNIDKYPIFIGTTFFAIQAIGVVVAVENNMKTPKSFTAYFGVFNIAQTTVVVLFVALGFAGYWKYGEEVEASITLNLPNEEILAQAVKLMYALAIFLTCGLQSFPAVKIIFDTYIVNRIDDKYYLRWEYLLRFSMAVITYIFAMTVPLLGLIISLVGCFSLSVLGIIFPPIIESLASWPDDLGKVRLIKNIVLITLGFIILCVGSYIVIAEIVKQLLR